LYARITVVSDVSPWLSVALARSDANPAFHASGAPIWAVLRSRAGWRSPSSQILR